MDIVENSLVERNAKYAVLECSPLAGCVTPTLRELSDTASTVSAPICQAHESRPFATIREIAAILTILFVFDLFWKKREIAPSTVYSAGDVHAFRRPLKADLTGSMGSASSVHFVGFCELVILLFLSIYVYNATTVRCILWLFQNSYG